MLLEPTSRIGSERVLEERVDGDGLKDPSSHLKLGQRHEVCTEAPGLGHIDLRRPWRGAE